MGMGEHRIVIERRGRSLEEWEPGEAGGIHERVGFARDEFPDEWDLVRARCSCGAVFEEETEVWAHLDGVAEPAAESMASPYLIFVDLFLPRAYVEANDARQGVNVVDAPVGAGSWSAQDVLDYVRREVRTRPNVLHNVVGYLAEPEEIEGDLYTRIVEPGTELVRLPWSAVVLDVVPEGQPVRVTNAEYGPYRFVDLPG